jgi:hypothetical protein
MTVNTLNMHAREKLGKGEDWAVYLYRCLPESGETTQVIQLTGSAFRIGKRGPRKGQRIWTGADTATRATAYITPDEHKAWCKAKGFKP